MADPNPPPSLGMKTDKTEQTAEVSGQVSGESGIKESSRFELPPTGHQSVTDDAAEDKSVVAPVPVPAARTHVRTPPMPDNSAVVCHIDVPPTRKDTNQYIEATFQGWFCSQPVHINGTARCACGLNLDAHDATAHAAKDGIASDWNLAHNTQVFPTDAFGSVLFQGDPHSYKSEYVRLGLDTPGAKVWKLLRTHWGLRAPKLVISVHGGILDFPLEPRLEAALKKGLVKIARSTPTWIITNGLDCGASRWIADAMAECRRNDEVTLIGIAPWGMVKGRWKLSGRDEDHVDYRPRAFRSSGKTMLLNRHNQYFLLVDDGCYGKWGADQVFRESLEAFIEKQKVDDRGMQKLSDWRIPIVGLSLEGWAASLDRVTQLVRRVPTVFVDGSGGISDLVSFALRNDRGAQDVELRNRLKALIEGVNDQEELVSNVVQLVRGESRPRVLVYEPGVDAASGLDFVVFKASIKRSRGRLNLGYSFWNYRILRSAMDWNRVDIAKQEIFAPGSRLPDSFLSHFAMQALKTKRVAFLHLLFANGFSLQQFLTPHRLEELYNLPALTKYGRFFNSLMRDLVKGAKVSSGGGSGQIKMRDVGMAIETLLGHAYKSSYTTSEFTIKYDEWIEEDTRRTNDRQKTNSSSKKGRTSRPTMPSAGNSTAATIRTEDGTDTGGEGTKAIQSMESTGKIFFAKPSTDMLGWAVLRNRMDLAVFFWERDEDGLAKALVAGKLFHAMAKEAMEDVLESDLAQELLRNSEWFQEKALQLFQLCYHHRPDMTSQLLTNDLPDFGNQTNLSLAVIANHQGLVAHSASQILLADLWMGGLSLRKYAHIWVLSGILCPVALVWMPFKTKEQLGLQPQTAAEQEEREREEDLELFEDDGISRRGEETAYQSLRRPVQGSRRFAARSNDALNLKTVAATPDEDVTRTTGGRDLEEGGTSLHGAPAPLRPTSREVSDNSALDMPSREANRAANKGGGAKLGCMKKIHEFYSAPITRFWLNAISYIVFLLAFSWVVLLPTQETPGYVELAVAVYVVSLFIDQMVRFTTTVPLSLEHKLRMLVWWDLFRFAAVGVFLVGEELRAYEEWRPTGRVVLALNLTMWFFLLFSIMAVFEKLGIYISMLFKMVREMTPLLAILLVVLTAFGIARQSIRFPERAELDLKLFRDVFFHPYFMLYGEVYAGDIDACGDSGRLCVPGSWVGPLLLFFFLLVANITIVNLLIAVYNNIFVEMWADSGRAWRFGRYQTVMEYESRSALPPPFSILTNIYRLGLFAYRSFYDTAGRCHAAHSLSTDRATNLFDYTLKRFLSSDDVEKLRGFEEQCLVALQSGGEEKTAPAHSPTVGLERWEKAFLDKLDYRCPTADAASACPDKAPTPTASVNDQLRGMEGRLLRGFKEAVAVAVAETGPDTATQSSNSSTTHQPFSSKHSIHK